MNKNNNKKERILKLNFNISKDTVINLGEKYRLEIGNITEKGKDNTVDSILYYVSESKKNRTIIKLIGENRPILNDMNLFNHYDRIFVVDTNSKDHKKCIGVFGELIFNEENGFAINKLGHYAFIVDNNSINPEKYTWNLLVDIITKLDNNDIRYGIVVDSELNKLISYNNGMPFLNDVVLPSNIRFIYATANKNDTVLNWAIKQCDKAVNKLWNKFYA